VLRVDGKPYARRSLAQALARLPATFGRAASTMTKDMTAEIFTVRLHYLRRIQFKPGGVALSSIFARPVLRRPFRLNTEAGSGALGRCPKGARNACALQRALSGSTCQGASSSSAASPRTRLSAGLRLEKLAVGPVYILCLMLHVIVVRSLIFVGRLVSSSCWGNALHTLLTSPCVLFILCFF